MLSNLAHRTLHAIPKLSTRRIQHLSMTPAFQAKKEFLVQIPDFPNTGHIRAKAQPAHAKQIQPLVESGDLTLGSRLLQKHPGEGEKSVIVGSVMIVKAESETDVRKLLEADAYTTEGAWDAENARIWPIVTDLRTAL